MILIRSLAAALILSAGLIGMNASASALRPIQDRVAPLCRTVETGERCQTRSGDVRTRGSGRSRTASAQGGTAPSDANECNACDVETPSSQRRRPNSVNRTVQTDLDEE